MPDTPRENNADGSDGDFRDAAVVARRSLRMLVRLPRLDRRSLGLIVALAAIAWLSTAIYKVQPDEQGVILRFGRWIRTTEPGLHFHLPYPIEAALLPRVTQINQIQLGNQAASAPGDSAAGRDRQMLTGDENIVEADCAVFWKIKDAGQ